MEDVNSQQAAGVLTDLVKEIARAKARVEAGLTSAATGDALKVSKDLATRGADAVDGLRNSITTWFNFYNGYDPLFTWWMGMPYKHVDAALQDYAAFLRDKVAPADAICRAGAASSGRRFRLPPRRGSTKCPTCRSLSRCRRTRCATSCSALSARPAVAAGAARRTAPAADAPASTTSTGWRRLKTLDFDALSRNAQVDYLFIKKTVRAPDRADRFVPDAILRARPTTRASRERRAEEPGSSADLADEMIPYTPEQLIALANKEFAWHEEEMKKASRQMGFGDDWKKAVEKVKGMYVPPGRPAGDRPGHAVRGGRLPARQGSDHRCPRSRASRSTCR